ncbi:MAG: cation:proton antiporter [Planctomycetaceae bacterium]|nr:cation:proton antiporter [Planctomycetaceae bacterium]MBT6498239.1 cation:proton antiporter [Planctomycetaceae bacterium]
MPESTHILVYIGLLFLASQIAGRVAGLIRVPRVVGYLIVGILLGPSLFGLLDEELVQHRLVLITDIALAIIAFSIGGSLQIKEIKRLGRSIFGITIAQALGAVICVCLALLAYGELNGLKNADGNSNLFLPMVLIVASVSAATAPAAVMGIVHEYRARGPLTTFLLGVVALDDALTIVLYAFAMTAAQTLIGLSAEFSWYDAILGPLQEIVIAISLGGISGFLLRFATRWFTQRTSLLAFAVGVILLTSGCATTMHSSPLLANMVLGFVVANFVAHSEDIFHRIEGVDEPIFGLFFALAGAHLDVSLLFVAGGLALLITLSRFGGKLIGTQFTARIFRAPKSVRRYLGISLLPQAGVTIGLILHARGQLAGGIENNSNASQELAMIDFFVNAVLASVVINELLTPFLLRSALVRAGEVRNNHPNLQGRYDEFA